jgi:FAD:protein FMN transferase
LPQSLVHGFLDRIRTEFCPGGSKGVVININQMLSHSKREYIRCGGCIYRAHFVEHVSGAAPGLMLFAVRRVQEVMGMPITVNVAREDVDPGALDEVFADFQHLDNVFSPFIETSEVSRIDRGDLAPEEAGELASQVIYLCRQYERATGGYFSAWIGGRFDPSGLVKGWAIDRACSILDRHGYRDFFVDAGGDVQTRGLSSAGQPWRVGVRHPVERDKLACVVLVSGSAVATSGTYEKGQHIIDPHTGEPASNLLSFTVVGPDILQADVFATAAFAMGMAGLDFIRKTPGYEAFAIDRQLRAWSTPGFGALCEAPPSDL